MSDTPEKSLFEKLRDGGGNTTWADFHETYWRAIYGWAKWRGCSEVVAQEVVQDVTVKAWNEGRGVRWDPDRGMTFPGFLYRLTKNCIADKVREGARVQEVVISEGNAPEFPDDAIPPDAQVQKQYDMNLLLTELRRDLDPVDWQILESKLKGRKSKDIARLVGLKNHAAVDNRFARMKKKLREWIGLHRYSEEDLFEALGDAVKCWPTPEVEEAVSSTLSGIAKPE